MAKKQDNMFGGYQKAVELREQELLQIQNNITDVKKEGVRKRGSDATTITLSISSDDKRKVKAFAAKKLVSVSDLLHQWITEFCQP